MGDGQLINKPNRFAARRSSPRAVTICKVEQIVTAPCVRDLVELAGAAETAAGIEQLAADCVRDRQLFPDGELQSWVDGYWKPAVDRRPDLARFKGLYVAAVKRLAIEELGALMLKVNSAAAAKEGWR